MHIQSIPMWVGTSNNYAYLVIDDKTKDAVIIDPANPPEVAPVLKDATAAGKINLTSIVNTHHHWDHAGGNKKLLDALGNHKLNIIGGKDCEGVTQTPKHEEIFKIGDISVKAVHTPCHTQDSICYYMEDSTGKAVFTGDTLFISGCGRFFEGNAAEMHEALNKRLASLPDDTIVYPGHEYTKANVQFAISVLQSEPVKALQDFAENNKVTTGKFTIGDEKKHNVFMRLDDPIVQKATGATDPVEVMAQLREMKNSFNHGERHIGRIDARGNKPIDRRFRWFQLEMSADISFSLIIQFGEQSSNESCATFMRAVKVDGITDLATCTPPALSPTPGLSQTSPLHPRLFPQMPPKRRQAASAGGSAAPKAPRQSKLAKEHNVSAQEENEIKEAYSLFAEPMDGEKNGVLPIDDVKSALMFVPPHNNLPPSPPSANETAKFSALGIPPTDNAELKDHSSPSRR
ncbi:hypothetical protein NLG97_g10394 [Lecanicillium saksenae]|uniref:Uncharacterized protein n=1 Tax=Lecanicillium saksenae TaxID=468837 RepID=A0ACC1QDJ8_9HYPO|nr:hypothetical protein NLG97_g10394 [Lecanicillium saksenae]